MTTTTRRALIGGAGLAAVVAVTPAIAVVSTPAASSAKWDRLARAFLEADAHMKTVEDEHTAAYDRFAVALKVLGSRPTKPEQRDSCVYPKPIEQMTIAEIKATPVQESPEYAAFKIADANWQAERDALETKVTGGVDTRWEDSVSAQNSAALALFAEPSPNADALRFKLDVAEVAYKGCDLADNVSAAIFADVRRLLNKEA